MIYILILLFSTQAQAGSDQLPVKTYCQHFLEDPEALDARVKRIHAAIEMRKQDAIRVDDEKKRAELILKDFSVTYKDWAPAVLDYDTFGQVIIENIPTTSIIGQRVAFLLLKKAPDKDAEKLETVTLEGTLMQLPKRQMMGFKQEEAIPGFVLKTDSGEEIIISNDRILAMRLKTNIDFHPRMAIHYVQWYANWFNIELIPAGEIGAGLPSLLNTDNLIGKRVSFLHSEITHSMNFLQIAEGTLVEAPKKDSLAFEKTDKNYVLKLDDGQTLKISADHVRFLRVDGIDNDLVRASQEFNSSYIEGWSSVNEQEAAANLVGEEVAALIVDRTNFDKHYVIIGLMVQYRGSDTLTIESGTKGIGNGKFVIEDAETGQWVVIDSSNVFGLKQRVNTQQP